MLSPVPSLAAAAVARRHTEKQPTRSGDQQAPEEVQEGRGVVLPRDIQEHQIGVPKYLCQAGCGIRSEKISRVGLASVVKI